MFSADGPIVNEKQEYEAWGAGYYMADFLKKRMYSNSLNIRQCAILAAYVIFQAKEHVDGCGGETHIAVLRNDGTSGLFDRHHIEELTEMLGWQDEVLAHFLVYASDTETDSKEFNRKADLLMDLIASIRADKRTKISEGKELRALLEQGDKETDFFGLPLSQKKHGGSK
jgi:hypothetical protein